MKRISNSIAFATAMIMLAFAASNLGAAGISAARGSETVLIVPARPAVIQLALDLAKMRDITIVSFRGAANSSAPLTHVWTDNGWQYVSFDDFCALRFVGKAPGTAIVIGDDQTVPKALLQGMAWPSRIERLQTLNAADLINALDPYFKFSSREWKRLADAHGLKLEDVNASKRDFNPYSVPRSKLPLATHDFKQEKDDTPPAVLIEKKDAQPAKPAEKTAEKPWIK